MHKEPLQINKKKTRTLRKDGQGKWMDIHRKCSISLV